MKIDFETGRIKSRWLFREVREGEVYPRFYRLAWYEPHRDCKVAMIFPLNIATNWLRTAWIFVSWKTVIRRTAWDRKFRKCKREAWEKYVRQGWSSYQRGFDAGKQAGISEVTAWINGGGGA